MAGSDPFGAYVSRVVGRWRADEPRARVVDGSIVFSDVSGFTALSERLARRGKLGAELMTDLLDAVFERLLDAATGLGGDLLAFGGDALCLLFDGPQHRERAAAAGLALQRALRARTPAHVAVGRISLGMSIGVHCGPVHLMRVGGRHRQLLALGPTVTGALGFEGAAERGEVLVSPQLAAGLPESCVGEATRGGFLLGGAPRHGGYREQGEGSRPAEAARGSVPPAIRREIEDGAPPQHRPATIAFLKVAGTDGLLARVGPEAAYERLEALVSAMEEIAERFDVCMLDPDVYPDAIKFLLAAGVPTATEDDVDRMLEAARAMVGIDTELTLRAGVNGGRVFSGPVGSPTRRSYTVIGDTVNLAARLMAHAPEGEVLAPVTLLDRARTPFTRTELPPFAVKGKAAPILAAAVGEPTAGERWEDSEQTPIAGRERERAELFAAWESSARGEGSVVELVGEPGIGKSRLVAEIVGRAGAPAFVAEGGVYAAGSPYRALIPGLFRMAGIDPAGTRDAQTERLADFVADRAPTLRSWLPLLAICFGMELPFTREIADLAPEFRRARLAELFVELLAAVIPGPALVLVEDAHWLDESSQELLAEVCRAAGRNGWLVVVTRRPVDGGLEIPEEALGCSLALEPLDPAAAVEIVRAGLDSVALPAQTIEALIERAGGNPFYLKELVAAVRATGDIDTLPETMESLIAASIDTLAPRDRRVLRQAAVLGRQFSVRLLRELVESERLSPTLTRLHRFLERDGEELRFRHALLRQTAYEGLPFRERARLHLRAAEHLEAELGDAAESFGILSLHFFHGRAFDRALWYSTRAAERAESELSPVEAAAFCRRALDSARSLGTVPAADRARLEESLADAEERASHYDLARAALRRARGIADDATVRARLLQKDGWIELRLGRMSQALSLNTRALGLVRTKRGREAARLRADLRVARAGILQRQGRWQESVEILRTAMPRVTRVGDAATQARAHFLLHGALSALGDESGIDHAWEAIRLFAECDDLYGQSGVYNNLGVEAYFLGRWSEAIDHYERSRELAVRIGDVVESATTMINLAEILCDQGDLDRAETACIGALEVFRGARYPYGMAHASSELGRVRVRKQALEEAHALFDAATEHFLAMGVAAELVETDARRVEALVVGGRAEEALRLGEATLAASGPAATSEGAVQVAFLERLIGAARFQLGDADAARSHWESSVAAARAAAADFELALTLECLSVLPGGDATEAAEILERLGVHATVTGLLVRGPAVAISL